MYNFDHAVKLWEDFLMEKYINYERILQGSKSSIFIFNIVGKQSKNLYRSRVDIDKQLVSLYIIVDTKKFDQNKVSKLSEYIIRVNNIVGTGFLQYSIDEQLFRYKLSNIVVDSEDIVDIISNGINCVLCIVKILMTVLDRIITEDISAASAADLTLEYLKFTSSDEDSNFSSTKH
jgi:hypothetical protein